MLLAKPFQVVTPTIDGDVLQILARADKIFTISEVHTMVGSHSYNGIKNALNRLSEQGIASTTRVGRTNGYRFNRDHLAADAITSIANMREQYIHRVRAVITETWIFSPPYAALFGSATRRDMRADSDIDIFVVRPPIVENMGIDDGAWRDGLDRLSVMSTAWTGNDTRILEMSEAEVRRGLLDGDQVLHDIQEEGTILAGKQTFWKKASRE